MLVKRHVQFALALRMLSVMIVAILFGAFSPGVASAALPSTKLLTLGNSTAMTASLGFQDLGATYAVTVSTYWGTKTASSARLNSIKVCVGGPAGNALYIRSTIYANNNSGSQVQLSGGVAKQFYTSTCQDYAVNRTYYASAGQQLNVITLYVTGYNITTLYSGYLR